MQKHFEASGIPKESLGYIRFKAIFFAILVMLFANSCIETIDFDTDRTGNQLVVDGIITDDEGPYTLTLSQTSFQGSATIPLKGAAVTIFDQDGNQENYIETEEGIYTLFGNKVKGKRGGTYYIQITLGNGTTYRSEPETIPIVIAKDSMYLEITTKEEFSDSGVLVEKDVINTFVNTTIPETEKPLFLRWKLEEVYSFREFDNPNPLAPPPGFCFVTRFSTPQDIFLFSGEKSDATQISDQLLTTSVIDFTYHRRHYFNAILYSTTKEAYEYWTQVDQVVNSTGTIFDVPPATPRSNLLNVNDESEAVLGYFEASIADTTRIFTLRSDVGKFIPDPCSNRQDTFGRPFCFNCLELPFSTKEMPGYWLEDNHVTIPSP